MPRSAAIPSRLIGLLLAAALSSIAPAPFALAAAPPAATSPDASKTTDASPTSRRIGQVVARLEQARGIVQTALSPDGTWIAWVVDEDGGAEIDLAATANLSQFQRITAQPGPVCIEDDLAWSPDSRHLAFTSNCRDDGQQDLYVADLSAVTPKGRPIRPRQLTHLSGAVNALAFSPDGGQIGFLYVQGATRQPGALDAMKPLAGVITAAGAEIQRVAAVGLASGQTMELSPSGLHVYEFDWSPDGRKLAYVAAPPPGEDNWWTAKLYEQNLFPDRSATGAACKKTADCLAIHVLFDPSASPGALHGLQIAVPRWSPDGRSIAFIGGLMSDQGVTGGDIYLLSTGGQPKNITPHSDETAVWIGWQGSDSLSGTTSRSAPAPSPTLLVCSIQAGRSVISTLDPSTGRAVVYATLPASISDGRLNMSLSTASDGTVAYIRSSFSQAPEVYLGQLGKPFRPVTHDNDKLQHDWGKAESVEWQSEGFRVQGWLLYPADYDPAKKYPLIVSVHGGPSSAVLPRWPFPGYNPIAFAALGYFVLMPNPRGSYGEGEAFAQANRAGFGHGDLRDILAGVDAVSAKLPIDPQRVGITGWSYGGFMAMFAITQTHRFRAAVAGAGISNWQSYYGENSIDQWMLPFFGASVYDNPAVYARSSAIGFIRNAKTPTLLVVGDRDGECPAPQSLEFWHALRDQHVPTELVVYPNEGHRFSSFADRRDVMERALSWFEQYMPTR